MLAPRAAWYLSVGWKLRDAEPSDTYLIMNRLGGGLAIFVAIILFITSAVHYHNVASEESNLHQLIKNTPIESITIQMASVTINDKASFKNWILDPDWVKVDSNDLSFGASSEIAIRFNNNQVVTIDHLMNGKFRLADQSSHYYDFSSPDLADWVTSQGQ